MPAPLSNLRIIDLSERLSGAFAGRLFGDFGASVTLIEAPGGHPLRHLPPFLNDEAHPDFGTLHNYANWNKQSVVPNDLSQLGELIAAADVVITNADPIDSAWYAPALGEMRDDAVHLSITAHGLSHPLAGNPGGNLTLGARTGWSFINRHAGEAPLAMPHDQAGYVGGVAGYIAAAAALLRRDESASAEVVDVSELEAFALTVHPWGIAAIYQDRGTSNGPTGGRPRGQSGPLWDMADGRMHFSIGDFHNWTAAMTAMGLPEQGERDDLIPDLGRHSKDMRDVSRGMIGSLPKLDRWPVFHELARLRCVVGVMQDMSDLVQNEQYTARDFLVETTIGDRPIRAAGAPAKLSPSPWRLRAPAPSINAHTPLPPRQPRTPAPRNLPAGMLADGPLAGIRVLSFGQAWSGTFGTELLGLLGADVVQVGSLHRPCVWRRTADQVPAGLADPDRTQHALNTQGLYNSVNLNKREITLDLRHERGKEILWQLLPRFDILADNFRPTVMPSWGITLEKLHELRPGMIWASISGYGESGPYAAYPANGATTEPMSGLSSLHGYAGDPGMNTGGLYPDPIAGYFLVATIMAAIHHRDQTGEPQRVDLSMMEAISAICGDAVLELDATGRVPHPRGNTHPTQAPHNYYACTGDEWIAIAVTSEDSWSRLLTVIGDPRLRAPQFVNASGRKANETELDEIITAWTAPRHAAEFEATLLGHNIESARVATLYELYSAPDPTFRDAGFVTLVDHPEAGETWLPGRPWRFSAAASSPVTAAPCVGQHSREILTTELGISDADYEDLVQAGVTGTLDDVS
jgi:crotonobetainyl-CoA:carnitine CoA-transferase CaiB-like acyl-CoA transferase